MTKKTIISLILILTVMLSVSACGNKQKTSVLTNNVEKEEAMQENEIKKFIANGTNFLNVGKYDDAKSSFEKAILMDKSNKEPYIEIKNKYMEKKRTDDAYYFIKLAVTNNVDTENMKKLLNDIKSKFEVTKVYVNVYQNNEYKLLDKIKAKINNEDKEVGVVWKNKNIDTSKVGTIKYEGKIEQYDRMAELNLKIIKAQEQEKSNPKNNNKVDSKNNNKVLEHSKNNKMDFTQEKSLEYAKKYYKNNEDLSYSIIPEVKDQNDKKYYEIVVKSKSFIKQGGTGTVGVIKVFEDGKIIEKN
ncbi:putative lipo domain protein [Clostridium sporogenes]|nr:MULTISPECIES: Ig-like domain-containing protein [Clostridium]APF28239.1 putative lipo domain protein [Clostridium sporogenes]MDI6918292.1 Ig-like domain-containing protein [Clostridium botulinum]WMU98310.1 Ig-like domain-containing protein [Clostridium botulinum]